MLKKTLLSGLALATLASASASQCASVTGFYAGLNGGLSNTNVDYKLSSVAGGLARNINSGKTGAFGGLFAGYGTLFSGCGYVGLEASFGFDGSNIKLVDDSNSSSTSVFTKFLSAKLSRKNYYGLAVRLGALVTPQTLAYVKLGAEGGKWELKSENIQTGYTGNDKLVKKNKSGFALVAGAGMETYITKNMFVGAEYSYLRGPTINLDQGATTYTTISTKAKVSQHRVGLRVGYKF